MDPGNTAFLLAFANPRTRKEIRHAQSPRGSVHALGRATELPQAVRAVRGAVRDQPGRARPHPLHRRGPARRRRPGVRRMEGPAKSHRPALTVVLVDSHCHLDAAEFDADRDAVVARAQAAGVTRQLVPAVDAASWPKLREVCAAAPGLYPAYGLHPTFLQGHRPSHLQELRRWIERER